MRFLQPKRLAVLGALVLGAGILAACVPPPPYRRRRWSTTTGRPPPATATPPPRRRPRSGPLWRGRQRHPHRRVPRHVRRAADDSGHEGRHHIDVDDVAAATIKAPASMAEPGDIIRINGATGWTIEGFVIAGRCRTRCSARRRPVPACSSPAVDLSLGRQPVHRDPPRRLSAAARTDRDQASAAARTSGTATITNNLFDDVPEGRMIVIDGNGSSADVLVKR